MSAPIADTFAEIVAGLQEQLPCGSVFQCSREALWWADIHGCERTAVCTHHMMQWIQDTSLKLAVNGHVRCSDCEGRFTTVEQLGTFRPL